ncbi:hypothetical protein A7U60_g3497 [Sanghuangporus baumii]|uniref:DUF6534 domain-containing protein n=1 Tax=Sanghuangporus baumii TaxID=108892 RepID=A0A9Q5N9U5_SANBA|nr:hypothetical protein A7U60_g3497 [Sanghuangporus baumii]
MSTSPDISSVQAALEQTLGYQLIGAFISLAVYGITLLQTYLYFSKFHKNDSKGLQALVVLLWILDTICSILVAHALYVVLVKGWGDVSVLTKAPVTFVLENGFTVLLTWIVQLFLAHRIWLVSTRRDYITPILVIIISAGAFGAGLALTSKIFMEDMTVVAIETDRFINVTCIIDQGLAAAADVLITLGLCFHLRKSKDNESGLKRTNNVINSLMIYFINRGALTSIFQVLALGTYTGLSSQQNWMIWHLILSKGKYFRVFSRTPSSAHAYTLEYSAYVNSLLAILNARTYFQRKLNGHNTTVTVSGIRFDNSISTSGVSADMESQDVRNSDKFPIAGDGESKKQG